MAKKAAITPKKNDLVEHMVEFTRLRNIDRAVLMGVLEDVFRAMIKKKYGSDENYNVIVNVEKGDLQVFRERHVVPDYAVEDENYQIALSDALELDPDYEIEDDVAEEVDFKEFGLRQIMSAKQLLAQKIKELEKTAVANHYQEMMGEIIVGEVYQLWRNEILVLHEENELSLPRKEQIEKDHFKKGDTIRAVVLRVDTMKNGNPKVIISRAAPEFLARLFEREVPEIYDGAIEIKKIVREPGEKAKVAVESFDDRIDPVGACVGMRGSRIHGIVRELKNENIDVINYSPNPAIYVQRALTPARPIRVDVYEEERKAVVIVSRDDISKAIGKDGQNVRLATRLTGYQIDVHRESEQIEEGDIDLEEFIPEIPEWIVDELKSIGCDTAMNLMELEPEELERRTDLELAYIYEVIRIVKQELEHEE